MATASATITSDSNPGVQYVRSLEELLSYYRVRGFEGTDLTEAELIFAVALARYRFAPPKSKLIDERLHVMVFGGAGSGKSTTVNILLGSEVAEVNAQAGYTRHPIAYFTSDETRPAVLWPEHLGPLSRSDAQAPANVDEDRFAWKQLTPPLSDPGFLRRHVVWDGPDLTAKDSTHYQKRVIEIAALAELTVYVASDERYNDELPTNFLQAMLSAGKWVVVVLTKVAEHDSEQFIQLFRDQVVSRLQHRERLVDVITIPMPPPGRFSEIWTDAFPYGTQLREMLENAGGDFLTCRRKARSAAAAYLHHQQARLLEPLRIDLGEWKSWSELIRNAANDAVKQYEAEYLSSVRYEAFEKAQDHILSLLQPAGVLQPLSQFLEIVRTPYRFLKSAWKRFLPALATEKLDEERCLDRVRRAMFDHLQIACSQRKHKHRLWKDLHQEFETRTASIIESSYQQARARQRLDLQQRTQSSVRQVLDTVEANSLLLNVLRTGRLLLDVFAVVLAVYIGYRTNWLLGLLLVPLGIGVAEDIVRMMAAKYMARQRTGLIHQQKENIRELIQVAYIDSLLQLPATMGRRLYSLANLEERLLRELAQAMAEGDAQA